MAGFCELEFSVATMFSNFTLAMYEQFLPALGAAAQFTTPPPTGFNVTFYDFFRQVNAVMVLAQKDPKNTYLFDSFFENFYATFGDGTTDSEFYSYHYMNPAPNKVWDQQKLIKTLLGNRIPVKMGCYIIETYQNPAAFMIQFEANTGFLGVVQQMAIMMTSFSAKMLYPPVCDTAPTTPGCSATVVESVNATTMEVLTTKHYTWSEFKTRLTTTLPALMPTLTNPLPADLFIATFHPIASGFC
jgi:hypothetical protein